MKQEYIDNLNHIVSYLSKVPDLFERISQSSTSSDGRDVSKSGEEIVEDELKKIILPYPMTIEYREPRFWHDVMLGGLPINIKITAGICPDNAGSKLAVYVACTGHIPEVDPKMVRFAKMLEDGINNPNPLIEEIDYVYLVSNKETKLIHWIGARQLVELQSNGKNQPFQIDWSKNILPVKRSIQEAQKFLLGTYRESTRKASEAYVLLDDVYNRVFKELQ